MQRKSPGGGTTAPTCGRRRHPAVVVDAAEYHPHSFRHRRSAATTVPLGEQRWQQGRSYGTPSAHSTRSIAARLATFRWRERGRPDCTSGSGTTLFSHAKRAKLGHGCEKGGLIRSILADCVLRGPRPASVAAHAVGEARASWWCGGPPRDAVNAGRFVRFVRCPARSGAAGASAPGSRRPFRGDFCWGCQSSHGDGVTHTHGCSCCNRRSLTAAIASRCESRSAVFTLESMSPYLHNRSNSLIIPFFAILCSRDRNGFFADKRGDGP